MRLVRLVEHPTLVASCPRWEKAPEEVIASHACSRAYAVCQIWHTA